MGGEDNGEGFQSRLRAKKEERTMQREQELNRSIGAVGGEINVKAAVVRSAGLMLLKLLVLTGSA
jgi:hypothetical protein